jgi:hypothetical protein
MWAESAVPESSQKLTDVTAGWGQPEAQSARYCPDSATCIRRGADDPDPERCSVPLPAGDHLDADRYQLPRVSVPGQPASLRAGAALAPIRAHSRALLRGLCIRRDRLGCRGFPAFFLNDVSAWRMAPSDLEHCGCSVRPSRIGWVMAAIWRSILLAGSRLRSRTSCSTRLRSYPH